MNAFAATPASLRHQCGAASVVIAMLLMFILVAAVATVMNISGSSVIDAAKNEEQVSALFLAEGGVERAQATISAAAQGGVYTDATCTGLQAVTQYSLDRGYFQYTAAVSTPSSCGGDNPACTGCAVTVKGTICATSRNIRTVLSTTTTDGVEGCGNQFTLTMTPTVANTAAFTNLAYRSKGASSMCGGGAGSNAQVGTCTNTGGSCLLTASNVDGWNLQNPGTNNVSGMGVYANVPIPGTYSITDTLVDNSNNSVSRNYVQTGALFYPLSGGSVSFIGSYGKKTGSDKTVGTSSTSSTFPSNWNCAPPTNGTGDGGTGGASVAAGADTLVYGFSSWPTVEANQLNGVTLGIQPLRRILNMTGTQGDNLYSQIWYSYNPAYFSTGAAGFAGATNGANFTGSIGATFTGAVAAGILIASSLSANAILSVGDTISCSSVGICAIPANTTIVSITGPVSGTYIATLSNSFNIGVNIGMTAKSNVLNVTAIGAPVYAVITTDSVAGSGNGDTINVSGTPAVLSQIFGTTGGVGRYTLSGPQLTVTSTNTLQSSGKTITLSGATSIPAAGTAIAVSSGNGQFGSSNATGSISGTTLTVTAIGSGTLNVGDALFGVNIKANTRITALGTGTGSTGTYTITPSQTAVSAAIIARTAVVSVASANSYTVSRQPTTRLSNNAQICGGVCTFLFGNTGSNTTFNLSNITAGDDWASGFACMRGVDPEQIKVLGTIVAKRSSWSEPVQ
ncbi:MAG: hypothetical protein Q7J21_02790 [Rugosibacter sp.]|nr:hypothetical protein [Rugosibacter sp.]